MFSHVSNTWNHEKRVVVQARKTSGFKAKIEREEVDRRKDRKDRSVMMHKFM